MAIAGLKQGAITLEHSNLVCGGITIGNKFTRCMGNHGSPDIKAAITHSCDGYFYRLGLKMGIDGIVEMVDEFDLNKRTGIDLPNEIMNYTPSREFKRKMQPRDPEWRDIDTVYASSQAGLRHHHSDLFAANDRGNQCRWSHVHPAPAEGSQSIRQSGLGDYKPQ